MLAQLHSRHYRCSGSPLVRRTDRFELEFKTDTYLTRRTPSRIRRRYPHLAAGSGALLWAPADWARAKEM